VARPNRTIHLTRKKTRASDGRAFGTRRMSRWNATCLPVAIALVVCVPSLASADMGVPMIVILWPGSVLALLPIIAIEAAVARRTLDCPWSVAVRLAGIANLVSSGVGVPVVWAVLFPLVIVGALLRGIAVCGVPSTTLNLILLPFYVAWLPPLEGPPWGPWVVSLCTALFCLPMYVASVWIEWHAARWLLPELPSHRLQRWAVQANRWTYSLIIATLLAVTLWQLFSPGTQPNKSHALDAQRDAQVMAGVRL
jgi:hypothetical protein